LPPAHLRTSSRFRRVASKASATLIATSLAGSVWYGGHMSARVDAADLHSFADSGAEMAAAPHGRPDRSAATVQLAGASLLPFEQVVEVKQGDTLMALLIDAGVRREEAHSAIVALEEVFAPRELRPGQEIRLNLSVEPVRFISRRTPQLVGLSLQPSIERNVSVTRGLDGGFVAEAIDRPLSVQLALAGSSIESSLFEAGEADKLPPAVMSEVIKAFSYDVDFQRDIQPGDLYEVVYERFEDEDGNLARAGDVLFASMTLSGKAIGIYRYTDREGFTDYYDSEGHSLRKALLKTPIDGARISSGFGLRKHPILGYSKMHKGIDFAAPSGTPIFAAGNGTIVKIGRNGSFGNYIRIKHANGYATAYAHLSKFAKGLKSGSKVKQGDVIAYVGSTGRATGPHLHYEVLMAGAQVNPKDVKLPTGTTLAGKELDLFQARRDEIERLRKDLGPSVLVANRPNR
jgi:murein DD-endopeptidase MepM/ murein hydrolase activator NlpD